MTKRLAPATRRAVTIGVRLLQMYRAVGWILLVPAILVLAYDNWLLAPQIAAVFVRCNGLYGCPTLSPPSIQEFIQTHPIVSLALLVVNVLLAAVGFHLVRTIRKSDISLTLAPEILYGDPVRWRRSLKNTAGCTLLLFPLITATVVGAVACIWFPPFPGFHLLP
jgi:hypothetical protein